MKTYKQITYKYLKRQKNRTLLTILGIVLSVAMISAVGTMIVSTRGALIQESMRENGSYHATFNNIDQGVALNLQSHVEVDQIGFSRFETSGVVKATTEKERQVNNWYIPNRYLDINSYDDQSLGMLPLALNEGRFPQSPDEIVIEYWMRNFFGQGLKIGDKINLTIGHRILGDKEDQNGEPLFGYETFEHTGNKVYTLVGFSKPKFTWRGLLVTEAFVGRGSHLEEGLAYNAHVKLANIKDANRKIEQIAKDIGVDQENITYNYKLLRLSAESLNQTFNRALVLLLIFIVLLIVISTIAVIYNAFNISVLERISEFGLLRSVGATPVQIREIVLTEALILSGIAIPIGLFLGVFAMKIVIYIAQRIVLDFTLIQDMEVTISWGVLMISAVIGLITVLLSAIGPTRTAGRVSPLEAIRNTGDLKKESFKKARPSKLIRKTLGIEGEIAYKNLRRNKKRFIITVFSMVISIALFITFSSFSQYMFSMGLVGTQDIADFELYPSEDDPVEEMLESLKGLEGVSRIYKIKTSSGEVLAKEDKIVQGLMERQPGQFRRRKGDLIKIPNVTIYTIGDENLASLQPLLLDGNIDLESLNENKGVLVVNTTRTMDEGKGDQVIMEGYKFAVGDPIIYGDYSLKLNQEDGHYNEMRVVGVLEKGIASDMYNLNGSINLITTETVWNKLATMPKSNIRISVEMNKDADLVPIRAYFNQLEKDIPQLRYMDATEILDDSRNLNMVMSIFLYGFVGIITLISSINIVNTISTNIILRTKEIAMIKAVGMSQAGIKRMVAYESLFYGIYAAIIGGTIGVGLTYVLFNIVIGISPLEWSMPWGNVAIGCLGATGIALLSGVYPLRRINHGIIVESMKADN